MKKMFLTIAILMISIFKLQAGDSDLVWSKYLNKGIEIYKVKFTPDGNSIAVAIGNGVYIYDIKTGDSMNQYNHYALNDFDISEDGKTLVTCHSASTDGNIYIWDFEKKDTLRGIQETRGVNSIRIFKNKFIIGTLNQYDSNNIKTWDLNTGKIIKIAGTNGYIYAMAISSQNNLFAVGTRAGLPNQYSYNVELWDLNKLIKITTLGSHSSNITDLAFSPDGKYLASASDDGIVKIWDVNTKAILKTLVHDSIYKNAINVKFSPKEGFLITGGGLLNHLSTKVWKMNSFELIYQYNILFAGFMDINQDSTFLVIGGGNLLYLLNAQWSTTGIKEHFHDSFQVLYPNPTGSEINIPIENSNMPLLIKLININGQIIKTINRIEPWSQFFKIDISSFLPGGYFVMVIYQDKTVTYKFEKIR